MLRLAAIIAASAALAGCTVHRDVALVPYPDAVAVPLIEPDVFGPDSIVQETYRARIAEQPPLLPEPGYDYYRYRRTVTVY